MTPGIFVDTGAWYALQVPTDRWHGEAVGVLKRSIESKRALITSKLILGETYTLLLKTHGHSVAWRFRDAVMLSPRLELVSIDDDTEKEAWSWLRKYSDQAFSYVDATSFALMKRRRLRHAFAFDAHFRVAGFTRVPIDE
jgi:predicted nucleic acid-binding protein